jgi:hypothetical protein
MPVSPSMAENLARMVSQLYENAEASLLGILADALARGWEAPNWVQRKLAAITTLRTAVTDVLGALQTDADGAVRQALAAAYERGQQAAVAELGAIRQPQALEPRATPGEPVVDRLARAVLDDLRTPELGILRQTTDVYRAVVAGAAGDPALGIGTRRRAAQRALDQFAGRGITGFVDRAGRSWDLVSYAEMATRSVLGRAAIEAHTDRLGAAGVDLVIVSDSPEECPRCRPWERKVLRREGPDGAGTVDVEHATEDGRTVSVRVAGSLPEARRDGLMHPNCRHTVSAYLPGVTKTPPKQEDRASYETTQKQRYLERQVRAWKRRAAAALDDDARRTANARVRGYQARIRELTQETGLPRKSHREQLNTSR